MPFALFAIISIGFLSEDPSEFLVPAVEGAGGQASASKGRKAVKDEAAAAAAAATGNGKDPSRRAPINASQLLQQQRQASLDLMNKQREEQIALDRRQLKYTNQVDALDRQKAAKQAQIDLLEKRKQRVSLNEEAKLVIEAQIEKLEDEMFALLQITIEAEEHNDPSSASASSSAAGSSSSSK